jgi:thiosulfate dehydrogenase
MKNSNNDSALLKVITRLTNLVIMLFLLLITVPILIINQEIISQKLSEYFNPREIKPYEDPSKDEDLNTYWKAFSINSIQDSVFRNKIEYGKELIIHTSKYFGPNGTIKSISNGLNCQNCHLDAGTKVFGNNYGSVASLYPKLRPRSGTEVDIPMRINDCFERSLNGEALEENSTELSAMVAYMNYIGSNVPKGERAKGSGLKDVPYIDRAADPQKGKIIYDKKCASCHMPDGKGVLTLDETEFLYPALWGANSFNDAAGLSRITKMARYVKYNMPLGVEHDSPQLSDNETWDVSAYILSQERPHLETPSDWPDITKKPIDYPFGPYNDSFSEKQHKFGPFQPILNDRKK